MKLNILTASFLLAFLTTFLQAQDNNCYIKKSFAAKPGDAFRLTNKYGDVNVISWKEDSVALCATVTIEQEDKSLLAKSMKMINVNIDKLIDTINITTVYDKKFFTEDSRRGRTGFSVDYLLKVPLYADIRIIDEFGNISVDELSGPLNIRLSQGILSIKKITRGNIKPVSSIFADHGKITIDDSNWLVLTLINCPAVNIGKTKALNLTSAISKIYIEDAGSIVNNSKSDSYSISSVNNLISESTYTEFGIGILNNQLKSKVTYGSLKLHEVSKTFSSIDITSTQAMITLLTGQTRSFVTDINVNDAKLDFPSEKFPQVIKTEGDYSTNLIGVAGPDKQTKSLIKIRATGGRVVVD
jgi:hypothetical protein